MVARNYTPQDLGYAHLLQAGESNGPTGSSSASANVHHAAAGDFLTLHHHQQQQQTSSQQQQTHLQQLQPASLHHHHQQQQQQQQQQHHHSLQPIVSSAPAGVTFKHHHQIGASDGNGTRSAAVTAVASANVQQQATVNSMAPQAYAPAQPQHSSAVGATGPQPMQYYDLNNMTESCSTSLYMGGSNAGSSSSMKVHHQVDSSTLHPTRKRKGSYNEGSDFEDDTGDDSKSVRTNDDCRKQNHSEIEKRRRDKMNTYIMELSSMVPMCHAMSRKLDKLTVLRMAVQHLKTIRGAVNSYTEGHYKPAFLSDQELKTLILQAAEGFLFVVGCDRGRILYVSESVSQVLNYSQGDLLGQSWFDILHPKDVAKVKEQLSSSDLSPRERLIDAKTMLPVKTDLPQGVSRLCPGARRSFFCRMKCKLSTQIKEEADTTTGCHRRKKQPNSDKKYSVIQCTGYLKSWAPAKIGLDEQEGEGDGEACNLSCLVAVGRLQPQISLLQTGVSTRMPNVRTIQFISRHAMDGKFLFVDQRATLVLGFLPQELLGTSMYEYYHHEDIPALAESHKCALQGPEWVTTDVYRFRSKEGSFVKLQSDWKSFRNPWTKDVEYLIAKNSVILSDSRTVESSATRTEGTNHIQGNFDFFSQSNGRDIQRLINSHVEASKIGRQIAEQVIDSQRRSGDSSLESSPDPDVEHVIPLTTAESLISTSAPAERQRLISVSSRVQNGLSPSGYPHVINNVVLPNDPESEEEIIKMMGGGVIPESTDPVGVPSDGNDEAAMAVIMSLLEADAGLGGPVDFSGLPWPLP